YMENLLDDEQIESRFTYEMPEGLRSLFGKSENVHFDIKAEYTKTVKEGESTKVILERSIAQHAHICAENSEDEFDALILAKKLGDDIDHRVEGYTKCISKSTHNFVKWLKEDYRLKLRSYIRENFDTLFEKINGHPPVG
ncbi:MAG: DEAD/DEAH box helicase, partial [Marinirhabdus sp.]